MSAATKYLKCAILINELRLALSQVLSEYQGIFVCACVYVCSYNKKPIWACALPCEISISGNLTCSDEMIKIYSGLAYKT